MKTRQPAPSTHRWLAAYGLVSTLIVALSFWLGQREFGGYDQSLVVDAAWREHLGQRPYLDFPNILPPLVLWLEKIAFTLFGIHWCSLVAAQALFFLLIAAIGAWLILIADVGRGEGRTACAFLTAVSIPQLVTVHIWHSADTSMLAVCLLTLCYLQAIRPTSGDRRDTLLTVSAVFIGGLLFLSKPNVGLTVLTCTMLFPIFGPRRTWRVPLAALGGGLLVATLTLGVAGINPARVLASNLAISDRLPTADVLNRPFTSEQRTVRWDARLAYHLAEWAVVLAAVSLIHRTRAWKCNVYAPLLIASVLTSSSGFATNMDLRANDVAPVIFVLVMTLPVRMKGDDGTDRALHLLTSALLLAYGFTSAFEAIERARSVESGPFAGALYGQMETRSDTFFGRFSARSEFWAIMQRIDSINSCLPAGSEIFYGPRLEFEYARTKAVSPHDLPIWWHPGTSYRIADEAELRSRFRAHHFAAIFLTEASERFERPMSPELRHYTELTAGDHSLRLLVRPDLASHVSASCALLPVNPIQ